MHRYPDQDPPEAALGRRAFLRLTSSGSRSAATPSPEFELDELTVSQLRGYPDITVPAGFVGGLPVGISFVGPGGGEASLIRLVHAFERATNVRHEPAFLRIANIAGPTR